MELINTIIIDDEQNNIDLLKHFLKEYCPSIKVIGEAFSKRQGIKLIKTLKPNLLFLDIMLDGGTGFELLDEIEFAKLKVVFITAHNQFAIKAFKYNAIDYLLKPINIEELKAAVYRVTKNLETFSQEGEIEYTNLINELSKETISEPEVLAVSTVNMIKIIKLKNLVFCKSDGRYTLFKLLNNKEYMVCKNLGEFEDSLGSNFFRIHNSYIINVNHIENINKTSGNYCEMINGSSLPIAKRRQDKLFRILKIK